MCQCSLNQISTGKFSGVEVNLSSVADVANGDGQLIYRLIDELSKTSPVSQLLSSCLGTRDDIGGVSEHHVFTFFIQTVFR
jgi:hypothetical protein